MNNKTHRLFVTVGTSVFNNLLDWAAGTKHVHYKSLREAWESHLREEESQEESDLLKEVVVTEFFAKGWRKIVKTNKAFGRKNTSTKHWESIEKKDHRNKCASAEIQSIEAILRTADWQGVQFELHLISTETNLSFMAAEVIKAYFGKHARLNKEIRIKKVKGLQIKDNIHFLEEVFQELINYVFNPDGVRQFLEIRDFPAVLNITGGYKGTIPVLTILGQILKIPIVYLYENSDQLITLHPLPISFNWMHMELLRYYFSQTNKKGILAKSKLAREELDFFHREIIDKKLMRKLNQTEDYEITYLGKMLNSYIKNNFSGAAAAFGMPIEFLFYEYLLNHPIVWKMRHLTWVEHSKKIATREFDLALYYTRSKLGKQANSEIIAIGEVASFTQLLYNNETSFIKKQFPGQIRLMKEGKFKPELYLLYLYAYQEKNNWKALEKNFNIMWRQLKNIGVERFEIHSIDLPLKSNARDNRNNIYTQIYQKKLTADIKHFESHEQDKYGNPFLLLTARKVFDS